MAFPNIYAIGITSLGFQIIWSMLAQRVDVNVHRLFTDQEEKISKQCDVFGISLSWELDGPILLDLLERKKIPLWSDQRKDDDPIVFGGGQVLTANPEPFAPFLDVVLLGDGEILIPKFIDSLKESKGHTRRERLLSLAQIPGIYVPSFYSPIYSTDGKLTSINTNNQNIPDFLNKQTYTGNTLTHSSVITPDAAWPDIHMVEVVRSCPELCRFCLASYLNLPFRTSSLTQGLIPAVEKGLKVTKRIGLLGASVTQHPEFPELLNWLNKDSFDDIRLSVSSVRASTVNSEMATILAKRNAKSLTIAIESGSERIRQLINKKLSEEEIYNAARYAKEGGIKNLKLYGMVGLPTEESIDIEKTANLIIKLNKQCAGLRITLGVSTFVPKAQTPFQWHGVRHIADKRLKYLAKKLKPNGIQFRPESYRSSVIQALISRSDRRLAHVIARMRGSNNSLGNWKKAYKEIENELVSEEIKLPKWDEIIHEEWDQNKFLPWSHINGPLNTKQLQLHNLQSFKQLKNI